MDQLQETSSRTIAVSLTEEETTQLLQRVPKAYRTEINDILLHSSCAWL